MFKTILQSRVLSPSIQKLCFKQTIRTLSNGSILDVLKKRPIIGDGSYVMTLEKRGYIKAGLFTVETVVENPDAVLQLHKDFLRAGADVIQALTFYATSGRLQSSSSSASYECSEINKAACYLANEVARPAGAFVCGGLSPTPTYLSYVNEGIGSKEDVTREFINQSEILVNNSVDFLLGEFYGYIEEAVWAIEAMKSTGKPVACTLRIGPAGDIKGVPPGECAVQMVNAGADIIGVNCQYDPNTSLKTIHLMKEGLEKEGLNPYLMVQPLAFHCPEVEHCIDGYHELPEYPFALEPRLLTRYEARNFARRAYEMGVHYIGGCCGFEPYHIREMAEELAEERGVLPPGHGKWEDYGNNLRESMFDFVRKRSGKEYWTSLKPASGRPESKATSIPASQE